MLRCGIEIRRLSWVYIYVTIVSLAQINYHNLREAGTLTWLALLSRGVAALFILLESKP